MYRICMLKVAISSKEIQPGEREKEMERERESCRSLHTQTPVWVETYDSLGHNTNF